jgi:hypothetical protein
MRLICFNFQSTVNTSPHSSLGSMPSLAPRLARICEHCPHLSDEVIDLHLGLQRRCLPGTCAKAFFRVAEEAHDTLAEEVSLLGTAFSQELAVVARGPDDEVLEKLPFAPEPEENLEGYCLRMMNQVFWDRSHSGTPLRLQFCYA